MQKEELKRKSKEYRYGYEKGAYEMADYLVEQFEKKYPYERGLLAFLESKAIMQKAFVSMDCKTDEELEQKYQNMMKQFEEDSKNQDFSIPPEWDKDFRRALRIDTFWDNWDKDF